MKIVLAILCSVFISSFAMAQENSEHEHVIYNQNITPYNDALEASQNISGVQYAQKAAWLNFVAQNPTWGARFNTYTGLPHRAFGEPIAFGNGTNYTQTALQFMQQKLSAYNLPIADLQALAPLKDEKYTNINFVQYHQQLEVLFSRATFRFNTAGDITLFGCDLHKNIPSLTASISEAQAIIAAKTALTTPIIDASAAPKLKIMPIPNGQSYTYHLVYEVTVNTQDSKEMPGKYYTLVDATNAIILYRQNKVNNVSHKVKGNVRALNWNSPSTEVALPNLEIEQNGVTYHTDANGNVSLPNATQPSYIGLTGLWCKVVDNQTTGDVFYNAGILANNDSTIFDVTAAATQETKVNAYYHVDKFHGFMKSKLPAFTSLDNQLLTRVDRTDGDCNAFYNGSSINFYYQGAGCASTAYLADVLYHEYGHGVTDQFWGANGLNFNNGAMGEGYSDMWAMSITDWPVIGPGFYLASATNGIRKYNAAPKVYPADIVGEVHADGEIIAGAWWDTRLNIGSLDITSSLFADSHYGLANGPDGAEGQVYFDILIDALTYDDNDGNINNGTPHFNSIVNAFAKHGIYLLSNTTISHTPAITAPALVGNVITADLVSDFPALVGAVQVFFRKKQFGVNNTIDSAMCSNVSGTIYTATLPAAPIGTIYEYYYRIKDNAGNIASYAPVNSRFAITTTQRNLPFLLPIGFGELVSENFENGNPIDWSITVPTETATAAGKWIVAKPVSSAANGIIVQTGKDHTTGNGNCAVTGNAGTTTASAGTADVDNGRTVIITKSFNLSGYQNPAISYWRWFANSSGTNPRKDFWRVLISGNNGLNWTNVERCYEPDVSWRRNVIRVKDYNLDLSNIQIAFIATDSIIPTITGGSLVEAAIDDFSILDLVFPTAIQNINALNASVFPNPANNVVSVRLQNTSNVAYQLVDVTGKTIIANTLQQVGTFNINTSNVAQGVYFLHLQANGKTDAVKLVIEK